MLIVYLVGCLFPLGIIWYLNKYRQGDIGIDLTVVWVLLSWVLPVITLLFVAYRYTDMLWRTPNETSD